VDEQEWACAAIASVTGPSGSGGGPDQRVSGRPYLERLFRQQRWRHSYLRAHQQHQLGQREHKDILTWLTGNHTAHGVFTSSWTLDLVQFGFEITSDGSTQAFVTNSYSVTSN